MCLEVYGSRVRYKIADKDIKVYKRLTLRNRSPYQYFLYKENRTYQSSKPMKASRDSWLDDCWSIHEGLHAHLHFRPAQFLAASERVSQKVVEMIIPKGTRYVLGCNYDIVADKMRVNSLQGIISL